MLCRAVPCFAVLSLANIPQDKSRQSWREPACPRAYSRHQYRKCSAFFQFLLVYSNNSSSMYGYVVEYENREHSTAKHRTAQSPLHKAANQVLRTSYVPIRVRIQSRSEYVYKEVCTYMHAAFGLFSWSMELLEFASPYLHRHSNPFFPRERAQRAGGTAR